MDFNHLVQFYERIDATSKRLEIIEIVGEMFRACRDPATLPFIKKVVYLTQGQLVAQFEEFPKFGVAEKMIIQAMVKFTAKPADSIKEFINKYGDVGEAVQSILETRAKQKAKYSLDSFTTPNSPQKPPELTIAKLYEELERLALTKGENRKIRI